MPQKSTLRVWDSERKLMSEVASWEELEEALSKMKPQQRLYEIVKKEMKKRGRWKALARGRVVIKNLKGH